MGTLYIKYGLTGGDEATDLDGINGNVLRDTDVSITFDSNKAYFMRWVPGDATAESSPDVIAPDSYTDKGRWKAFLLDANWYLKNSLNETICVLKDNGLVADQLHPYDPG